MEAESKETYQTQPIKIKQEDLIYKTYSKE